MGTYCDQVHYVTDPGKKGQDTFDPEKQYTGIRLQQGVPLLDRDWNELEDIRRYEKVMLGKKYIGNGTPDDRFKISKAGSPDNNFPISPGRCMVDGLEVENNAAAEYTDQDNVPALTTPASDRIDTVYLDVWIKEVRSAAPSGVTNPDKEKVDPDLGNTKDVKVETSVRHKLVWRVRVDEGSAGYTKEPYHNRFCISVSENTFVNARKETGEWMATEKTTSELIYINLPAGKYIIETDGKINSIKSEKFEFKLPEIGVLQKLKKLPLSSWGIHGNLEQWLTPETVNMTDGSEPKILNYIWEMEIKYRDIINGENNPDKIKQRLLDQMWREILLAQHSDWLFMYVNGDGNYAVDRVIEQHKKFMALFNMCREYLIQGFIKLPTPSQHDQNYTERD